VVGQTHIVPVLLPRVPCRRHGGTMPEQKARVKSCHLAASTGRVS
jgi:hypothetical protein